VADELRRLLPAFDVSTASVGAATDQDAVLTEEAKGVTAAIGGQVRYFEDPGARCAERGRMVAVFIAVVLDPPRFALPPPPPAPPPSEPPVLAVAPAAPVARSDRHLDIEFGPTSQAATADGLENVPLTAGATLRLLWGRTLRLSVGVSGQSAATLLFGRANVRGQWIPVDAGLRWTRANARWDGGGELSLAVAPVHLIGQGQNLSPAEGGWRVDLGARLAASVRYWMTSRFGIFLAPDALIFPRPYNLSVGSLGIVGETPKLWLGLQLGLAVRLR
jgi:hypothetical protein